MPTMPVAEHAPSAGLGRVALVCLPLFFGLQALAFRAEPATTERAFILITGAAALLTAAAAAVRAVRGGVAERRCLWLVVAFPLWIGGQVATLAEGSVSGTEGSLHSSVLLFSLFSMPILGVTSINRASHPSRATYYLDAIAVVALTYAFVVYNTDVIAQSRVDSTQAFDLISRNFAIEGALLALFSLSRMLAAESSDEWGFFRILSEFLVFDLLVATPFNYVGADASSLLVRIPAYGVQSFPFLLFAYRLSMPLPRRADVPLTRASVRAILLSLGPSTLTIVLVLLAIQIMEAHDTLGAALLTLALACYAGRNMVTQSWFIQSRDALVEREEALHAMARTDPLTGVGNRRLFDETLEVEWERAMRMEMPLALLFIDVDAFKAYNDTYGHEEGDRCLQRVVLALRVALPRAGDVLARYGGEEFVALLPNTSAASARVVAQRLCDQIAALEMPHRASPFACITVSVGVSAALPRRGDLHQALANDADRALYSAKAGGRNRVVLLAREPAAQEQTW